MQHVKIAGLTVAAALAWTLPAAAQTTTWDMPTPYADGNFHTKNVREFAADVERLSGGKLKITVHSNASLVKHPEIPRAIRTGQVQIGEILISTMFNEDPMFGFDSNPGVATSYAGSRKLYGAAKPFLASRLV